MKIADKILRFGYPLAQPTPLGLITSSFSSAIISQDTSSPNPYQSFIPEFVPCYERQAIIQRAYELRKRAASQRFQQRLLKWLMCGAVSTATAGLMWYYGCLAALIYLMLSAASVSFVGVMIYGLLNIKALFNTFKHPSLKIQEIGKWFMEKVRLFKSEKARYINAHKQAASRYRNFKLTVGTDFNFNTYMEKIGSQFSPAQFENEALMPPVLFNELQALKWQCRQYERLVGEGKLSKHTPEEIINKLAFLNPKDKADKIKSKYLWMA